jgi:hypothetical protein
LTISQALKPRAIFCRAQRQTCDHKNRHRATEGGGHLEQQCTPNLGSSGKFHEVNDAPEPLTDRRV